MPCCDFQISENHRCGSYAFNLWQEGIEQKYCDRHHWQDEATRLRAEVEALKSTPPDKREDLRCVISDLMRQHREGIDALKAEVEALRAAAERKNGLLLWALYHSQGGSSPVGQSIRRHLGIGRHDHLTPDQINDAARAAQGDN